MKNAILLTLALLTTPAFADGFVCESKTHNLKIRLFNQTQPELGVRNPAIMVLSDPSISAGRRTIATFSQTDGVLTAESSTYTAKVDLRFSASSRSGELIAGTRLGELKNIIVDVAFSYAEPVAAGTVLPAEVTLVKRNGDESSFDVECVRYLRGE